MARKHAVQFLYQCEADKIFYFSVGHFERFLVSFEVPDSTHKFIRELTQGTLDRMHDIDQLIEKASKNWKLSRMSATDRGVLRLATYELIETDTPTKVIINEAIDIAKLYGTEKSGSFVNGILDSLGHELRQSSVEEPLQALSE
jgi:N utilization substance protein B